MRGSSPINWLLGVVIMASSLVNFMSYNSTGLNTIKTDWIRDLINSCDIHFFQLQEHFKKTKTLDYFFKSEFPFCDSYVIPAHREPGQESGRAKVGLAQLTSKKLNIRKKRISMKSWCPQVTSCCGRTCISPQIHKQLNLMNQNLWKLRLKLNVLLTKLTLMIF